MTEFMMKVIPTMRMVVEDSKDVACSEEVEVDSAYRPLI
jgi:hypothetical protein